MSAGPHLALSLLLLMDVSSIYVASRDIPYIIVLDFISVMPSPQTTLFDSKCNRVIDFGTASRNTLRWSPNGKYILLASF